MSSRSLQTALPAKSWAHYEGVLRLIGENRNIAFNDSALILLGALGLVRKDRLALSDTGVGYFQAQFVGLDEQKALGILAEQVESYPPSSAILQLLAGVDGADRHTAETVLRNQGFGEGLTDRKLGALLALMNRCGLIKYIKRDGSVRVLVSPAVKETVPDTVFVTPETPFGNIVWLKRIPSECGSHIYWFDKHFVATALDFIWEVADAARINKVRILSVKLDENSGKRVRRNYRRLRTELGTKRIDLEWRFIDSSLVRDVHD